MLAFTHAMDTVERSVIRHVQSAVNYLAASAYPAFDREMLELKVNSPDYFCDFFCCEPCKYF